MEFKDYYKILGVERSADQDEIRSAYRKLARKYHPDVSSEADAEERFKDVAEAYEVLKDAEKRAAYDQLGANWREGEAFRPPPDWNTGFEFRGGDFSGTDSAAFSEFFETLFGGGMGSAGRARGARWAHGPRPDARGEDRHARVLIDLEDAFAGATRQITLQIPETTADGRLQLASHTLNVRIPQGIRAGQHIRLAGQGGVGPGGRGDLYLEVVFREHPLYRVDGRDLYLELPVTPSEAALGASVRVPTPAGPVTLKVPAGSQPGRQLRLKERGLPGTPAGDLYAVLQVTVPPADTPARREAYEALAAAIDGDPRGHFSRHW